MKNIILIACLATSMSMTLISCSNTTPAGSAMESKPVQKEVYTCSMHPEIKVDKPGDCPKCGMPLVIQEHSDTTHILNKSDTTTMMK